MNAREIGEQTATPLDPFYGGDNPGGLTIRQAYKIAAMNAVLMPGNDGSQYHAGDWDKAAKMAGDIADAMLQEDAEHAGRAG